MQRCWEIFPRCGQKTGKLFAAIFFAKKIKLIPDIFVISFENRKIFPDSGGKRSIFYNEHREKKNLISRSKISKTRKKTLRGCRLSRRHTLLPKISQTKWPISHPKNTLFPTFQRFKHKKGQFLHPKSGEKNPVKLHRKYVEFLSRHRGKRSNFYNEHRGEKKIQEKKKKLGGCHLSPGGIPISQIFPKQNCQFPTPKIPFS